MAKVGKPSTYEMECSAVLERNATTKMGFTTLVPTEGFETRDLTSGGTPSAVGVQVRQMPGVLGWSAVVRAGATLLGPLKDDVKLFHDSTLPTATWTAETGAVTPVDPVFTYTTLRAKRLTASFIISQQLLAQTSSIGLDKYLASKMKIAFASMIDQACLYGSGPASNQPTGVINASGAHSFAVASPPVWSDIAAARFAVTNYDADNSSFSWITSPSGRKFLESTARFATAGVSMWDPMKAEAEVSLEVNDKRLFGGLWSYLVIGFWAGDSAGPATDLVIDPYTLAKSGETIVTGSVFVDVGIRWPQLFGFSPPNTFP
jgi:hypothetical protein